MTVDRTIIGSTWPDDPELRKKLQFDPDLARDHALVRGIAIHLYDRWQEAERALQHGWSWGQYQWALAHPDGVGEVNDGE